MWSVCYNIGAKWKCDCIELSLSWHSSLWDFGSPGCWGLVSSSEWGANGCWVDAKGVVTPSIAPRPFPPVHLDPVTWASLCSGFWLSLVNGSYWQKIRERDRFPPLPLSFSTVGLALPHLRFLLGSGSALISALTGLWKSLSSSGPQDPEVVAASCCPRIL